MAHGLNHELANQKDDNQQADDADYQYPHYEKFANFFLDDPMNLMDIMEQLGTLPDDEKRIKEELFRLLWFFIMTFYSRQQRIKKIILKNRSTLKQVIQEFSEQGLEEEEEAIMQGLNAKLDSLQDWQINILYFTNRYT